MNASPPRRRLSTRLIRRLVWIAVAVTVANLAFVAFYDASDQEALLADVVSREIQHLDAAVRASPDTPVTIRSAVQPHFAEHTEAYAYVVVDPQGRIVDGMNASLIPAELLDSPTVAGDWVARKFGTDAPEAFASHVVERPEGAYRVHFAIVDDPANLIRREIWDEFFGHVWLPLLPTMVLLIGGALLILRRDLGPVGAAAAWARQIRPGMPSAPFHHDDLPAEIEDLTDAVNRAIDRLNTELGREKRRAAEAAHALRTPVAVLVARLDGLPDDPALNALRDEVKVLSRTVTQFLLSSGADRLELDDGQVIDLNSTTEETVARLTPFAILNGSEVIFAPASKPRLVQGTSEAIDLALTNLIENAVLHGGGGQVEVSVGPDLEVTVSDSGPGLVVGTDQDMFRPFWRGKSAPKGGAGLGLAIVARIQRAHGGRVEASNRPGGGAVFRLTYPPIA